MYVKFEAQKRVYVIRKLNTRICSNYIQHVTFKSKKKRNLKKKYI